MKHLLGTLASLILAANASAQSAVGIGEFSSPTVAGDETIALSWKDSNGVNKTLEVSTGLLGTNDRDDDLPKGMDAKEKAKRIAAAIDAMAEFEAKATGHVVTVTGEDGNTLEKFKVKNNTKEKKNTCRISEPGMAMVDFGGGITGVDGDGEAAQVHVGTDVGQVTVNSGDYESVEQMVLDIAVKLTDADVSVTLAGPRCLAFVLGAGEAVHYGCSDVELTQSAEVAKLEYD